MQRQKALGGKITKMKWQSLERVQRENAELGDTFVSASSIERQNI